MSISMHYNKQLDSLFIIHADCIRRVGLSVFPHDISEYDSARITKLDGKLFQDEFWKFIYFGGHKIKVTSRKSIAGVGLCTLLSQYEIFRDCGVV